MLQNGFNWFTCDIVLDESGEISFEKSNQVTLFESLQHILKIQCAGREGTTVTSYRSFVNTFCDWLTDTGNTRLLLSQANSQLFQQYIFYKLDKGHGNRNINDTIRFFSNAFEKAKKVYGIRYNPIDGIDKLPKRDSELFKAITPKELERIKAKLLADHPHYYCYTLFTAHEFVRPKHIAYIQRRHIDFERNEVFITADSSKNKKTKTKQLMQPVKDMLLVLGMDKLPGNFYLFANNDFTPGAELYPSLSKRSAELWKRIVIDGLGIDKKMYSLKHTGASYFVNNNDASKLNLRWLQQHLEHHSLTQTEQYLQGILKPVIDESDMKSVAY